MARRPATWSRPPPIPAWPPAPGSRNDALGAILARSVLRPANDDRAEAEAHAVADRVVGRIGEQPGLAPVGGQLPEAVSSAVAAEVGSMPRVAVHHDALAAQLAQAVGARAFTAGADVYLGSGQGGARLLAHEAAHAALHPQPAADVVHAYDVELSVDSETLIGQGGGADRFSRHTWNRLISAVSRFEAAHEAYQGKGAKKNHRRRVKLLKDIEQLCMKWLAANVDSGKTQKHALVWRLLGDIDEERSFEDVLGGGEWVPSNVSF